MSYDLYIHVHGIINFARCLINNYDQLIIEQKKDLLLKKLQQYINYNIFILIQKFNNLRQYGISRNTLVHVMQLCTFYIPMQSRCVFYAFCKLCSFLLCLILPALDLYAQENDSNAERVIFVVNLHLTTVLYDYIPVMVYFLIIIRLFQPYILRISVFFQYLFSIQNIRIK